jgi:hypothetical protein
MRSRDGYDDAGFSYLKPSNTVVDCNVANRITSFRFRGNMGEHGFRHLGVRFVLEGIDLTAAGVVSHPPDKRDHAAGGRPGYQSRYGRFVKLLGKYGELLQLTTRHRRQQRQLIAVLQECLHGHHLLIDGKRNVASQREQTRESFDEPIERAADACPFRQVHAQRRLPGCFPMRRKKAGDYLHCACLPRGRIAGPFRSFAEDMGAIRTNRIAPNTLDLHTGGGQHGF